MLSTALLLVGSMVVGQAEVPEQFKEYGKAFAGKWISEFELDADIPGVAKRGDKVAVRGTTDWILENTAVEGNWSADLNGKPAGTGKWIASWDRSSNEIVSFGVDSFGGRGQSVFKKVGDRWIETATYVGPDGRKTTETSIIVFSDDGNTQSVEITGRISPDGKPLPNIKLTSRRVKSPS